MVEPIRPHDDLLPPGTDRLYGNHGKDGKDERTSFRPVPHIDKRVETVLTGDDEEDYGKEQRTARQCNPSCRTRLWHLRLITSGVQLQNSRTLGPSPARKRRSSSSRVSALWTQLRAAAKPSSKRSSNSTGRHPTPQIYPIAPVRER